MTAITKLVVSCFVVAGTVLAFRHGANALQATLPGDMPANAQFVQSGYDIARNEPKGEWIACRSDTGEDANFCRVTDPHGMVIYEGDFLPVYGMDPVPDSKLKVATNEEEKELWIDGPTADGPVPLIPLADGDVLAPIGDASSLASRWSNDPAALRRVQGR